jgi:hypothetical protein
VRTAQAVPLQQQQQQQQRQHTNRHKPALLTTGNQRPAANYFNYYGIARPTLTAGISRGYS